MTYNIVYSSVFWELILVYHVQNMKWKILRNTKDLETLVLWQTSQKLKTLAPCIIPKQNNSWLLFLRLASHFSILGRLAKKLRYTWNENSKIEFKYKLDFFQNSKLFGLRYLYTCMQHFTIVANKSPSHCCPYIRYLTGVFRRLI